MNDRVEEEFAEFGELDQKEARKVLRLIKPLLKNEGFNYFQELLVRELKQAEVDALYGDIGVEGREAKRNQAMGLDKAIRFYQTVVVWAEEVLREPEEEDQDDA